MESRNPGRTVGRRWPAWLVTASLAVALAPAAARGYDAIAPRLRPEQVRLVQRALQERGLRVEPSGAWDAPTRAALAEFQSSRSLPATGELDADTVQALGVNLNAARPASREAARAAANRDPMYNCEIYNTIDCDPGGGG